MSRCFRQDEWILMSRLNAASPFPQSSVVHLCTVNRHSIFWSGLGWERLKGRDKKYIGRIREQYVDARSRSDALVYFRTAQGNRILDTWYQTYGCCDGQCTGEITTKDFICVCESKWRWINIWRTLELNLGRLYEGFVYITVKKCW